ncbi:MAG: thiamine pyrophosphate-binding protein [Gammaproteobacteria bacterium]|nr:thiamine pyrophosphate-binding protein [Gammaproteobacteria bacterium]
MPIHTESFVQGLIDQGVSHLCVVPCSFAKFLINEAINNPNIDYLPCASEAIACSIAAGLKMAGKKPVVVVQSSGITNMGSCITSLLNPYGVQFPIITSWRTYKEGDSEIQHKHLATELPELIKSYGYEYEILDNENLNNILAQIRSLDQGMKIGVLKKNSFTKVKLLPEHRLDLSSYVPRSKFLNAMNQAFANSEALFVGTTGNTAREMYSFMPDTENFYMAGNMGGALSVGVGAAKAGKKVIVCGGDAEFVMHMGGLTTAGRYAKDINLTYILFDNESNKSTGGQNTYQAHVNYISIAKASGLSCHEKVITNVQEFVDVLIVAQKQSGLSFIHVKCGEDPEMPRPPLDVVMKNKF